MTDKPVDVSVIIPFVNEDPQIRFTLQAVVHDLSHNTADAPAFEVVCVNNYNRQVEDQGLPQDGGHDFLSKLVEEGHAPWLKLISYDEKLSHWNAKNAGVTASTGEWLLFLDAHVLPSPGALRALFDQAKTYIRSVAVSPSLLRFGSIHLPITYMLTDRALCYQLRYNLGLGVCHYRFMSTADAGVKHDPSRIFKSLTSVPCMSSCGMLMPRAVFTDVLQGFPTELGIYGGGENFANFVLGVCGYDKLILNTGPTLAHHAAPRGYRFDGLDWIKNRLIAVYLAGGEEWLNHCADGAYMDNRARRRTLRMVCEEILHNPSLRARREHVESLQQVSLDDWINSWKNSPMAEHSDTWA